MKQRHMDEPTDFQLGPAQPIMERDYGRKSNYNGECSQSVVPMRRRKVLFDDGVRIGSKDR
jgi:hypothetical protein